jgi:hypothetical protein
VIAKLRRYRWAVAGSVVLAVVLAVVLWPSSSRRTLPPTRERVFVDWRACLATGPQGLADPAVAPVWAGMQDASGETDVQVTYLAAQGDGTPGSAEPFVASLADGNCGILFAVGPAQTEAVASLAPRFPKVRFVDVGGASAAGNFTLIPEGSAAAVRAAVADAVESAYGY